MISCLNCIHTVGPSTELLGLQSTDVNSSCCRLQKLYQVSDLLVYTGCFLIGTSTFWILVWWYKASFFHKLVCCTIESIYWLCAIVTYGQRILMRGCMTGDFSLGKFNVTLTASVAGQLKRCSTACRKMSMSGPLTSEQREQCLAAFGKIRNIICLKSAPSHWGSGPHLVHSSLGPPESISQMASRLV